MYLKNFKAHYADVVCFVAFIHCSHLTKANKKKVTLFVHLLVCLKLNGDVHVHHGNVQTTYNIYTSTAFSFP